jgi:hypothetical protein
MLSDESLLERVRERVAQQKVPCDVPRSILVTPGVDQICAVCDVRILEGHFAYELEFGAESAVRKIHLHHRCYTAWDAACLNRGTAG